MSYYCFSVSFPSLWQNNTTSQTIWKMLASIVSSSTLRKEFIFKFLTLNQTHGLDYIQLQIKSVLILGFGTCNIFSCANLLSPTIPIWPRQYNISSLNIPLLFLKPSSDSIIASCTLFPDYFCPSPCYFINRKIDMGGTKSFRGIVKSLCE